MELPWWTKNNLCVALILSIGEALRRIFLIHEWPMYVLIIWILVVLIIINLIKKWVSIVQTIAGYFGNVVYKILELTKNMLKFFTSTYLLLTYLIILSGGIVVLTYLGQKNPVYLLIMLMLVIFIPVITQITFKYRKAPFFSDGFDNDLSKNWKIIEGVPSIDKPFGKPSPSLVLPVTENPQNSFVLMKDNKTNNFSDILIECDIYLKPSALINILFRCDKDGKVGYMARLDSRGGTDPDRFLIKKDKNNWEVKENGEIATLPGTWQHVKLEVKGSEFKLFKNNYLVCWFNDETHKSGFIGLFNECGEAHIDNFIVSSI